MKHYKCWYDCKRTAFKCQANTPDEALDLWAAEFGYSCHQLMLADEIVRNERYKGTPDYDDPRTMRLNVEAYEPAAKRKGASRQIDAPTATAEATA